MNQRMDRAMPPTGNEDAGADELSDSDIALLCDIGGSLAATPNAEKRARLERLLARGFLEPASADKAPAKYQLTGKAMKALTDRGVGLNEA
jgi:hypothetical protein